MLFTFIPKLLYVRHNSTKKYTSELLDTLLDLNPHKSQKLPLKAFQINQTKKPQINCRDGSIGHSETYSQPKSSVLEISQNEEKTIQTYIKLKKTDQCLQYIGDLGYPNLKSNSSILDSVLKLMLKEDRLDQSFQFITSFYKWDFKKAKIIIQHLTNSQQQFLILPFAYSINHLLKDPDLIEYAWLKISKLQKQHFGGGENERWWLVNHGLVKLSLSRDSGNVDYSRLMNGFLIKRGFPHWKKMIGKKQNWTNVEDTFVKNYLWVGLPRFAMSRNTDSLLFIADLFNDKSNFLEINQTMNLCLDKNEVETAFMNLEPMIKSLPSYHEKLTDRQLSIIQQNLKVNTSPFIKYYVRNLDLLGLLDFTTSIESRTSIHVKYEALSHYALELLKHFNIHMVLESILDNGGPIEISIKRLIGFLYQETYSNGTIWTYSNVKTLNQQLKLDLVLPIDYSPSKLLVTQDELQYAVQVLHHNKIL